MSGPVIKNPTPLWMRPENASVFDSPLEKGVKLLAKLFGADDPSGQVMGIAAPVEVPGGTSPIANAVGAVKKGIRAFHGSPHDFDKFSLSKIGTGEGAQAYGHGLYFADSENVAKSYRDTLSGPTRQVYYDGKPLNDSTPFGQATLLYESTGDANKAIQEAAESIGNVELRNATIDHLKTGNFAKQRTQAPDNSGRMYEVSINADPEDFLDWDAPLSQQTIEAVRSVPGAADVIAQQAATAEKAQRLTPKMFAKSPISSSPTGSKVIAALESKIGPAQSTEALKQAGIPGIKYLDGASRSAGQGSRNYVVFDDKLIEILKKYGLAGAISGGYLQQAALQQAMQNSPQR